MDDPDSQGPASSATSGTEEGPRPSSDHLETEDNPQLQEQAQSSASSSDHQRASLRHNLADGGQDGVIASAHTLLAMFCHATVT